MPTYESVCESCRHNFEAFQSMSESPLSSCPECGGAVRRLIGGGTGIIFKGSGFYVNDSRKSSSGSVGTSSAGSKPSTEATPAPTSSAEPSAPPAGPKSEAGATVSA